MRIGTRISLCQGLRDVHVGLRGRGFRRKFEAQLEAEVKELLARAEAAHKEPLPEGLSIPAELARREERLAAIGKLKHRLKRVPPRVTRRSKPTLMRR